jgi:peptidoglycan/LPS O-acetylase OafA/YrhL
VSTSSSALLAKPTPILSLTGLRFYAALLVFIDHLYLFQYFLHLNHGAIYTGLFRLGGMGVAIFFVLSGFVLFLNYGRNLKKPLQVGKFFIARFARVYPVFFLTTLLAIPMELMHPHNTLPWLFSLLINLSVLHCLFPATWEVFNNVGWSIGNEAFFYLSFPVLLLLFKPKYRWWLLSIAGLLFFIYMGVMQTLAPAQFYAQDRFPLNRLFEFGMGMFGAYLYLNHSDGVLMKRLFSHPALKLVLPLFLTACFFIMWLRPWAALPIAQLKPIYFVMYAFPALAFIMALALTEKHADKQTLPMHCLTHPWAILGGEISYSFYLVHNLYFHYLLFFLTEGLGLSTSNFTPVLGVPIISGLFIVTLLSAYALFKWVETPCRKWLLASTSPKKAESVSATHLNVPASS